MKKYTLFLFALAFILLVSNANSASASNCAPGDLFNSTTGQPCSTTNVVDCLTGDLFSSATGQPCNVWHDNSSINTQFQIGDSGDTVKAFQQTLVNLGFLVGKVDGKYGPITNGAALRYYKKYPFPTRPPVVGGVNAPVISGVSGPQSLSVNEQGTWAVTASSPTGGNLSYSVVWGDEFDKLYAYQSAGLTSIRLQDATFSHIYAQPGTYKPTFTVTNERGLSAQTSLSVNVGGVVPSSITVLSPNGGETWTKGTTQTINWRDASGSLCPAGVTCIWAGIPYDIKLVSYYPPCTTNICPMSASYPISAPRTIASNVYSYSYDWVIPKCPYAAPCSYDYEIAEGSYTVQVCQTGTDRCDSSDSYFKITSPASTNSNTY